MTMAMATLYRHISNFSKCGLFLAAVVLCSSNAAVSRDTREHLSGQAVVVDGDTIQVDEDVIDLFGIDAPELGQLCGRGNKRERCGLNAALRLKQLIEGKTVKCRLFDAKPISQTMMCAVDNRDLSEMQLSAGQAVATEAAIFLYLHAEANAKKSGIGIWRSDFVPPAEWREGRRLQNIGNGLKDDCMIKGIVRNTDNRIYVVPTDPDYEKIELDSTNGEKFFCSDDAAELSGWNRWNRKVLGR